MPDAPAAVNLSLRAGVFVGAFGKVSPGLRNLLKIMDACGSVTTAVAEALWSYLVHVRGLGGSAARSLHRAGGPTGGNSAPAPRLKSLLSTT